jgi:ribosome maturation protein Sdo1
VDRETNLDDVLQIENVFVNVSKGEVAKAGDLQKAFGTTEISGIVKEVCLLVPACVVPVHYCIAIDIEEG